MDLNNSSSNWSGLGQLGLAWGRGMAMEQMRVNIYRRLQVPFSQSLQSSDDSNYYRPLHLYTHDNSIPFSQTHIHGHQKDDSLSVTL